MNKHILQNNSYLNNNINEFFSPIHMSDQNKQLYVNILKNKFKKNNDDLDTMKKNANIIKENTNTIKSNIKDNLNGNSNTDNLKDNLNIFKDNLNTIEGNLKINLDSVKNNLMNNNLDSVKNNLMNNNLDSIKNNLMNNNLDSVKNNLMNNNFNKSNIIEGNIKSLFQNELNKYIKNDFNKQAFAKEIEKRLLAYIEEYEDEIYNFLLNVSYENSDDIIKLCIDFIQDYIKQNEKYIINETYNYQQYLNYVIITSVLILLLLLNFFSYNNMIAYIVVIIILIYNYSIQY